MSSNGAAPTIALRLHQNLDAPATGPYRDHGYASTTTDSASATTNSASATTNSACYIQLCDSRRRRRQSSGDDSRFPHRSNSPPTCHERAHCLPPTDTTRNLAIQLRKFSNGTRPPNRSHGTPGYHERSAQWLVCAALQGPKAGTFATETDRYPSTREAGRVRPKLAFVTELGSTIQTRSNKQVSSKLERSEVQCRHHCRYLHQILSHFFSLRLQRSNRRLKKGERSCLDRRNSFTGRTQCDHDAMRRQCIENLEICKILS